MAMEASEIQHVPPPWKLKGIVYLFNFKSSTDSEGNLPAFSYSPLERASSYASPENGRALPGSGTIQLIRYTESPVGPYDEFILSPGIFEYRIEEDGKSVVKKAHRITRIYVSQRETCWNGRKNWNIPKHLAKFDWNTAPDGTFSVKVYPHDTDPNDPSESKPSAAPFFQTSFKPIPYLPAFPFSMDVLKYVGQQPTLVQPPLPEGKAGGQAELLPGTQRWCAITPGQRSSRTSLGWFDLRQPVVGGEDAPEAPRHENFWPGLGRWQLGCVMEECVVDFPEGSYWKTPASARE